MTIRAGFYPLLGENVNGLIGDLIDALSISCTTFGVCTSLGLGVTTIATTIAASTATSTQTLTRRRA